MKSLKVLIVLTLVLVVSALGIAGFNQFKSGYDIGDHASDFRLKDVSGELISLSDFDEAKGFIVVFTCNTCPFAIANQERIQALDATFKPKGYPVIAINPNNPEVKSGESYAEMQKVAKDLGVTYPYLYDANHEVYAAYGATKTPHVYVLQKEEDALIVRYIGAIDDSVRDAASVTQAFVADAVEALLNDTPVTPETTKAIGCAIKA